MELARSKAVRRLALAGCLLSVFAPLLLAQLPNRGDSISELVSCRPSLWGRVVVIADGVTDSDCTVGGATPPGHRVTCICDPGSGSDVWHSIGGSGGGGGGGAIDSITATAPITSTGGSDPILGCAAGSTSARGCNELATSAETTAGLVVQASDTRLSDSRAPSGSASGDLTGTYPGPTIAANSVALGTDTTGGYAASSTEAGAATSVAASSIDTGAIADGAILNADINASAAIALTKLAAATADKCARFDASGVLVPASGDCPDGDTTGGGGSPAGSGSELQFRLDGTTFGAVTSSGVSGADVTLGGTLDGVTQLSVDNLRLDGNTLSSTDTNGSVTIDPNGSGNVEIASGGLLFDAQALIKPGNSVDQTFFPIAGIELRNAANTAALDLAVGGTLVFGSPATNGTAPKQVWRASNNDVWLSGDFVFFWSGTNGAADGRTTNIQKGVDGTVDFGTAANKGDGYFRWGGECYTASDQTNATDTLQTAACLGSGGNAIPVVAGRKYTFECSLFITDSTAAEGVKVDFGGGTAAATAFRAHFIGNDTAMAISTQVTSLTGAASASTFTGDGLITATGAFEPSSSGTFQPRFAQNTHVLGTATLYQGSHCRMWETP